MLFIIMQAPGGKKTLKLQKVLMNTNKIRAVISNMERDKYKKKRLIETMKQLDITSYEILKAVEGKDILFSEDGTTILFNDNTYPYSAYSGELPFRKTLLTRNALGYAMSNYMAWNAQQEGYVTLLLEEDAVFIGDAHQWEQYMQFLPAANDYDIIFLSDCTWSSQPYPVGKPYNDYYHYLPKPHYDISGAHAYIINSKTVELLNEHFDLTLATDDFLNYCIHTFQLKVLAANQTLFTQRPENYKQQKGDRKYTILFYNSMFDAELNLHEAASDEFELVSDHAHFDTADAVVFHMPGIQKDHPIFKKNVKKEGQLWVFWTMECRKNYEWQFAPEILSLFDITMTYQLDADVPIPYLYPAYRDMLRRPPAPKTGLINAFISSDINQSNRLQYLKELMSYLDVHSYGKALNNRQLENDNGLMSKASAMASYKFTIAFENAIDKDYVTEKFYHPLILGSVPVYLGAPNIVDFEPGHHCFINVKDFSSMKELADYLLELDQDDQRYDQYLQWKKEPYKDEFLLTARIVLLHPYVRLCEMVKLKLQERARVQAEINLQS